jgi:negative regulator of flagellin synthesis FlgM
MSTIDNPLGGGAGSGVNNTSNLRPSRSDNIADSIANNNAGVGQGVQGVRADDARTAQQSAPAGASDAVSLTRTASELQQLESQLLEAPGIDVERIEAIRQAIVDGSYNVDAGNLVDNLLRTERELG